MNCPCGGIYGKYGKCLECGSLKEGYVRPTLDIPKAVKKEVKKEEIKPLPKPLPKPVAKIVAKIEVKRSHKKKGT